MSNEKYKQWLGEMEPPETKLDCLIMDQTKKWHSVNVADNGCAMIDGLRLAVNNAAPEGVLVAKRGSEFVALDTRNVFPKVFTFNLPGIKDITKALKPYENKNSENEKC